MVNVYDVACNQFTDEGSNIVYDLCMAFPYDPVYNVVYAKIIFVAGYPAITIHKSGGGRGRRREGGGEGEREGRGKRGERGSLLSQ